MAPVERGGGGRAERHEGPSVSMRRVAELVVSDGWTDCSDSHTIRA